MNLGKLLGAGKSFFGGKVAVKYRENRRVYVPKFQLGKNPFLPAPQEPLPEVSGDKKGCRPDLQGEPSPEKKSSIGSLARATRVAGWKEKFNPFRQAVPVVPSMRGAVQTELSLDTVKVIRNDLVDAEIEVVPVKSQTIALPEVPILPPARNAWEFLGERLVRAE